MSDIRFSVVLPTNRNGSLLDAAVESTLTAMGTHDDLELLVVGDGIDPLVVHDARVRTATIEGGGIVAALNAGLEAARGEYVVRMDGDDVCHPRRLLRLRRRVDCFPGVAVHAAAIVTFGTAIPRWEPPVRSSDEVTESLLHTGYALAHPAAAFRRSTVLAAGGYKLGLEGIEDLDLWLRLAQGGSRFLGTTETAVFYRRHRQQVTRTDDTATKLIDRIALDSRSSRPCGVGCPGRLRSLKASLKGCIAEVCPRYVTALGIRALVQTEDLAARTKLHFVAHKLARLAMADIRGVASVASISAGRRRGRDWIQATDTVR